MLSPAVEDYLKTIFKLQDGDPVSTSAIAANMDISAASVTGMAKRLSKMGLVSYESYRGVVLTDSGRKVALEIIRHHRLLELYLKEVLDYSWEQLHDEAEHLEHHISEEFESKIEELLGFPTHDPHGHPIPTRDGEIPDIQADPLTSFDEGETVFVQHVSDSDPKLLEYLEGRGLMPQVNVTLLKKAPFNGPVTVRIDGSEQVIGHEVAGQVYASKTESGEAE